MLPATQLTPFRFAVATGVFFANFNNALLWATYAAVTPSTAQFYDCSEYTVNLVALVFQIVFIPCTLPSMYIMDSWGLRPSVLVGTWGVTLGALIRWLGSYGNSSAQLPLLFVGQIVAASATPFAFNAPAKVSALWFGDKERLTANTFMSLSIYAGTAVALAISPAVVAGDPANIPSLNLISFIIVFITGLTSLLVFNKPVVPPSLSAHNEKSLPFWEGLKALAANPQFIILLFVYGVVAGSLDAYFTLISDYIVPYGYTETDAGVLGNVTILVGTLSSLLLGPILDRTKLHRVFLKLQTLVTFLGTVGFYFAAPHTDRRTLLFASAAAIGMGGLGMAPLALELGVECTFPIAEGSSSGLLQTAGQVFGVLVLVVSNSLRGSVDGVFAGALLWRVGMCALVVLLVPFYNARSRRMELEAGDGGAVVEEVDVSKSAMRAISSQLSPDDGNAKTVVYLHEHI
ncbi:major facilitator superfamily domain-containing protein [Chytriomyces sp. MP71]|nr:major facilitator superfamily domain-containing protein [Chytriomyces sp. MP71]